MPISSAAQPIILEALDGADTVVAMLEAREGAAPVIREAGGAWLRFSGHSPEELAGQSLTRIADPQAGAMAALSAAFAKGTAFRGDLACRARDGQLKWLGLHVVPAGGRGAVLIGRDITAPRKEAAESRLLQGLLLKSFQASETSMAIVAGDDRIMLANAPLETLLGYPAGGLTGLKMGDLVLPPYRATFAEPGDGTGAAADIELYAQNRSAVVVRAAVRPIQMGEAAFTMVSISARQDGTLLPKRLSMAGKVRFVTLGALRDASPDPTGTGMARLLQAAETIVRRHLQPQDLLSRTADHGFAICFTDCSEAEATEVAAAIGRDLQQQLAKQGKKAPGVGLSAVVSEVALPAKGAPDMAAVSAQMDRAEADLSATAWPPPETVPITATLDGGRAGCLVRIVPPRTGHAAQAFPESRNDLELAALQAASSLPMLNSVLVDVSFSTFLHPATYDAYVAACEGLPAALRERLYLVFSPLPPGITQAQVQEVMWRLGRLCAGFALRLEGLQSPELDLAVCRPALAIIDAARWNGGLTLPAERTRQLTSLMHAYRVRIMAQNVDSQGTAKHLAGLGVDWMALHTVKAALAA